MAEGQNEKLTTGLEYVTNCFSLWEKQFLPESWTVLEVGDIPGESKLKYEVTLLNVASSYRL